jgi:hypothetical protein
MNMPHLRYVTFSYAATLTERDNRRFRDLMASPEYRMLWGERCDLRKTGETLVSNDKTGWKLASSVGGVGTGERGNRVFWTTRITSRKRSPIRSAPRRCGGFRRRWKTG